MKTEYGDLGGVICPDCGHEVFRILGGRCVACNQKQDQRTEGDIEMTAQLDGLKKQMSRARKRKVRDVDAYWKAQEGPS